MNLVQLLHPVQVTVADSPPPFGKQHLAGREKAPQFGPGWPVNVITDQAQG